LKKNWVYTAALISAILALAVLPAYAEKTVPTATGTILTSETDYVLIAQVSGTNASEFLSANATWQLNGTEISNNTDMNICPCLTGSMSSSVNGDYLNKWSKICDTGTVDLTVEVLTKNNGTLRFQSWFLLGETEKQKLSFTLS
jgi:hypothetical protein